LQTTCLRHVILEKTDNYKEFKGAMAENFICCELKRIYEANIYYWTAEDTGRAEIDFIVQDDVYIVPIEVKAGTVSHARSLSQYCKKYRPEKSVLTSMDYEKENVLPLYAFWKLKEWLKSAADFTAHEGTGDVCR